MNDLYRRARAGDARAVARVVETLRPRLTRLAAHYARRAGENPDDLLQEAWLGLLEAVPRLDLDIGSPEQYLIQHARWRLLDAVRRAHVRRCAPLDECGEQCYRDADIAAAWIAEFAGGLKSTQRAILECLLRGLTWREAGDVLGCTSANIAYHVRQIQRRYEDWHAEPV
ncbi:MAG: sigma-70 family RNA polymerase sigma factor [Armatimonadetes bacterium]|nr:sigma-70 family RNA polymerase sigma factor [Armatimonadota bacterium]